MSMEETKILLVKNGFIKKDSSSKYRKNSKGYYELIEGGGVATDDANVEVDEESDVNEGLGSKNIKSIKGQFTSLYLPTGYPPPHRRFRLMIESPNASIEEPYFWILDNLRQDNGFPYVDKITDIFSASEQSAFWGASQARLGIQQDRVSQYLKGISELIKQLFALVRELRIIDEKLQPRKDWSKYNSADVTLKGEYTDIVENKGGQVAPGSVYHLAQTVGYAVLPDLFFNTHIYKMEDIDKKINELKFNPNVKNVLRRKMYAFINWKLQTDKELNSRRLFVLRYLRQHWNTIKMYMNWVKPYLKNIARLQMNQEQVDSVDLISAFETSIVELEFLAYKESRTTHHPCILVSFRFRTRPDMSFQKDQYAHKGPIHVGRMECNFRSYAWTKDQMANYKKFRREEDMRLLGMVDESVKAAMDALGDELEKYLAEAGEREFEEKQKDKEAQEAKKKKATAAHSMDMLDPFVSVLKGFGEMFSLFMPNFGTGEKSKKGGPIKSKGKDEASIASGAMFLTFKNFKKSHGMLSW